MQYYYSPNYNSCFVSGVHIDIPTDAIKITQEQSVSIYNALNSAKGFVLETIEGVFHVSRVKFNSTLDEARTTKQRQIAAAHDAFLKAQSMEYSEMERQTWDSQRTESQALLADPQAAAPLVRAIANARGMDVIEMARRIQENTQAWSVLAGHATGQRLAFQDALEACTTVEQVESISVTFSLPE